MRSVRLWHDSDPRDRGPLQQESRGKLPRPEAENSAYLYPSRSRPAPLPYPPGFWSMRRQVSSPSASAVNSTLWWLTWAPTISAVSSASEISSGVVLVIDGDAGYRPARQFSAQLPSSRSNASSAFSSSLPCFSPSDFAMVRNLDWTDTGQRMLN